MNAGIVMMTWMPMLFRNLLKESLKTTFLMRPENLSRIVLIKISLRVLDFYILLN
jgi:hypothetical protein